MLNTILLLINLVLHLLLGHHMVKHLLQQFPPMYLLTYYLNLVFILVVNWNSLISIIKSIIILFRLSLLVCRFHIFYFVYLFFSLVLKMQSGDSYLSGSDGLTIATEVVLEMESAMARSSASHSATTYTPSITYDTAQPAYSAHQPPSLEILQMTGDQRFNQITLQSNQTSFHPQQQYLVGAGQRVIFSQASDLSHSQTLLQSSANEVPSLPYSPLRRPAAQPQSSFPSINPNVLLQASWQPQTYVTASNQSFDNSLSATAAQQQYMMPAAQTQQLMTANDELLASFAQQSFPTGNVYATVAPSVVGFVAPTVQLTPTINRSLQQQQQQLLLDSYAATAGAYSQACQLPPSAQFVQSSTRLPLTAAATAPAATLRPTAGVSLANAYAAPATNCFDLAIAPELAMPISNVQSRARTQLCTTQAQADGYAQLSSGHVARLRAQASIPFRLPVTYPAAPPATALVLDSSYWGASSATAPPAAASTLNTPPKYQSPSAALSASMLTPVPLTPHSNSPLSSEAAAAAFTASNGPLPQSPVPVAEAPSAASDCLVKRRRELPPETATAHAGSQRRSSRAATEQPTARSLDDRIAAILGDPHPLQPPSRSTTRLSPSNSSSGCHSEPDPFSVLAPLLSHPTPPSIATDSSTGNCDTGTTSSPAPKLSSDMRPEQQQQQLLGAFDCSDACNAQNDSSDAADRQERPDQFTLFVDTPAPPSITERKRAYESIKGVKIRKKPAPSPDDPVNGANPAALASSAASQNAATSKKPRRGRPSKAFLAASKLPVALPTDSSSSDSSRAACPLPDARHKEASSSEMTPVDGMASTAVGRRNSSSSDDTSDFSLTPPDASSVNADGLELVSIEMPPPARKSLGFKLAASRKPGHCAAESSNSSSSSSSSRLPARKKRALESSSTPSSTCSSRPLPLPQRVASGDSAPVALPKLPKTQSSAASPAKPPQRTINPNVPSTASPKSPPTSRQLSGARSPRDREPMPPVPPTRDQQTRASSTPETHRDQKKPKSPRPAPAPNSTSPPVDVVNVSSPVTASSLKAHAFASGGGRAAPASGDSLSSKSANSGGASFVSTQIKKVSTS